METILWKEEDSFLQKEKFQESASPFRETCYITDNDGETHLYWETCNIIIFSILFEPKSFFVITHL